MMRFVGVDGLGAAHDGAQLVHGLNVAQCHGLREQVADGSAFHGTGDDRTVEGVGCKLVEQFVLAAAADDVQRVDALALDLLQTLERPAVFERQRFIDAPRDLPDGLGTGWFVSRQKSEFSRPSGRRRRIRRSRDR